MKFSSSQIRKIRKPRLWPAANEICFGGIFLARRKRTKFKRNIFRNEALDGITNPRQDFRSSLVNIIRNNMTKYTDNIIRFTNTKFGVLHVYNT